MDHVTQLRVRNVRVLERADLDLARPVTVLIGENGAGKSTLIECAELLRHLPDSGFFERFFAVHRGLPGLLRSGATELALGVTIEDDAGVEPALSFDLTLAARDGNGVAIVGERFTRAADVLVERVGSVGNKFDVATGAVHEVPADANRALTFYVLGGLQHLADRLAKALRAIEVHVGFDNGASWVARSLQRPETLRGASTLFPAPRLALRGTNLASAWMGLRNRGEAAWTRTLEIVRLGLGDRVDSVVTTPDPGGGNVWLGVRFADLPEVVPASNLSDGQLAWLAFVAMALVNPTRSLLVLDEPDLHLHPSLLGRVVDLLSDLDGGAPVLVSTHSDRVLELVDDPADAVRVCVLEGSRATIRRLDRDELAPWLQDFGDVGAVRRAGWLPRVLAAEPTSE